MKKFVIGASLAVLVAVPALAYQAAPHPGKDRVVTRTEVEAKVKEQFARLDANKDGVVTLDEIKADRQARMKERADRLFERLDTDKNGQLSRAEFDARLANMGEKMAERRQEGGPGHRGEGMRGEGHRGGGEGMRGGHRWGRGGGMDGRWYAAVAATKDGKITLAQATATRLAWFDKIDTNKDGKITPDERKAAFAKMRAERAADRAKPK